jgi:RNA polymerase sigma-70 factor (ECF subfamily)
MNTTQTAAGFEQAAPDRDTALMLRVRDGDAGCFGALYDRHRAPLVQFLFRKVGSREVAEELAQEVFLRVHLARATYVPTARFTTWLYRIATNRALNWLRDHRREREELRPAEAMLGGIRDPRGAEAVPMEERIDRERARRRLREAIDRLPGRQREVVRMRAYQDLEHVEIARAIETSSLAVRSLLCRAQSALRSRLAL